MTDKPLANPGATSGSCCSPSREPGAGSAQAGRPGERPGYRVWPFVSGWLATPVGRVPQVKTNLDAGDRFGRWQMRWGLGRQRYRVAPGLYAVGNPGPGSPVLVSANYKLSFDVLRSNLPGLDAWLLVIETHGINVWCAAGKGTFGTAEIVHRVAAVRLPELIEHRTLVVPQLGAPGVAAHQVARGCGFRVVYGPVRAADLPAFLAAGMQATAQMRRVSFSTLERLVLTPVELTGILRTALWAALALLFLGAIGSGGFSLAGALQRGGAAILAGLGGVFTGAVLVPLLLPWMPCRAFAAKGALAGMALAFGALAVFGPRLGWLNSTALLLALPAVASWCGMNFTGSSTFTSPSGVEKEMRRAIPLQGAALLLAGVLWVVAGF
ncbi:hypothetical protein DESUT3_30010 [Desulfuromonas versatilis]|uniref:CO dehydrogenase/acetyl-CoA synthase delta subunit TIM barrel domain-containing protein n=1 Tax=Desulfuromonas versatilis TaxID=2802975 RepID=A0ABN6E182_9BACT|nr:mercury methylation corrinoid protein HgcA [Desulfuromonas versatilis]BCR05932.1 hypothetical protein DESUT3_30010 [Desulfuromonas versatilis]